MNFTLSCNIDPNEEAMDTSTGSLFRTYSATGSLNNNRSNSMDTGLPTSRDDGRRGYQHKNQLQVSSSPPKASPRSRPIRRGVVKHMRPIQVPPHERPVAMYCVDGDSSVNLLTPNVVSFPASGNGHSPARRSPNRSRTTTSSLHLSTSTVNLRRRVKSGADGGLRAKKAAARTGATLSPKRKGGIAANVGNIMRTVKSFVGPPGSAKEKDTGRKLRGEYVFRGTGRMRRASSSAQDRPYFQLPTPTAADMTINNSTFSLADNDNDHTYVDNGMNTFETSYFPDHIPASFTVSNSLDVDDGDNAERAPNPTERRTTASGGGRNKLIGVLGPEVKDILVLEAPAFDICAW